MKNVMFDYIMSKMLAEILFRMLFQDQNYKNYICFQSDISLKCWTFCEILSSARHFRRPLATDICNDIQPSFALKFAIIGKYQNLFISENIPSIAYN